MSRNSVNKMKAQFLGNIFGRFNPKYPYRKMFLKGTTGSKCVSTHDNHNIGFKLHTYN